MVAMNTNFDKYEEYRNFNHKKEICHAPFVNMYFNSWGNVGPCWLNLEHAPKYPEHSLKEIWNGEFFRSIRKNIKNKNLEKHCSVCKKRIEDGVFGQTLAKAYDLEFTSFEYPSVMEFELSNLCNLACIMCKGTLSSKIRSERENLSPLQVPYDGKFVQELKEFLPHLKEARFNGGEPFLQKICWDIWEQISIVNPNILVTVATNGTILTDKMKSILLKCNFRINVSLDAMTKELYESIRIHSNFDTVIKNIEFFSQYCKVKNTIFSIMVNPMRNNWHQIPDFLSWCNENQYHLWFNTIWRPRHLALWTLPSADLKEIKEQLNTKISKFNSFSSELSKRNYTVVNEFINGQIQGWIQDQKNREDEQADYSTNFKLRKGSKESFISKQVYKDYQSRFEEIEEKTKKILSIDSIYYFLLRQDESEIRNYCERDIDTMTIWLYTIADYY